MKKYKSIGKLLAVSFLTATMLLLVRKTQWIKSMKTLTIRWMRPLSS